MLVLGGLLCAALLRCDSETIEGPAPLPYHISGTLTGAVDSLPDDAEVVIMWSVSATSPDYSHVFGKGEINLRSRSFSVVFEENPPERALNAGMLGVGVIVVARKGTFENHQEFSEWSNDDFFGGATNNAVIFIRPVMPGFRGWEDNFKEGFSVGKGVDLEGEFDGFEPTSPSKIEITIDDMENLEFVNWT